MLALQPSALKMENTEKLLLEISQKIDGLNQEMRTEFKQVNDRIVEVEKSIVKLDEKIAGIDKRLSFFLR